MRKLDSDLAAFMSNRVRPPSTQPSTPSRATPPSRPAPTRPASRPTASPPASLCSDPAAAAGDERREVFPHRSLLGQESWAMEDLSAIRAIREGRADRHPPVRRRGPPCQHHPQADVAPQPRTTAPPCARRLPKESEDDGSSRSRSRRPPSQPKSPAAGGSRCSTSSSFTSWRSFSSHSYERELGRPLDAPALSASLQDARRDIDFRCVEGVRAGTSIPCEVYRERPKVYTIPDRYQDQ